jgi:hypothetical protein
MAKTYRYRKRKIRRKKTNKKNLVGGSFSEAGSFFSYLINNTASIFTVPISGNVTLDPRVTNQFIYQK